MPVVNFLQLLIATGEVRNLGLKVLDFGSHGCLLLLEIKLILLQFFKFNQISLEEDAIPVVIIGLALLVEALVHFQTHQLLPKVLIFFENFAHLAVALELSHDRTSVLVFLTAEQMFLGSARFPCFGSIAQIVHYQQQPFVFVVEVLNLYLHLVNLGRLYIFFEAHDDLVLLLYLAMEILDVLFESQDQGVAALLEIIVSKHLLHFPIFDHSISNFNTSIIFYSQSSPKLLHSPKYLHCIFSALIPFLFQPIFSPVPSIDLRRIIIV